MYWRSGEAGVEERMGQAVIESFKAPSLLPWFGTDLLLTLIQALAVHMLLIWIFFLILLWKVWSVPSPWLTSHNAKVLWCKYFPVLQSECYHEVMEPKWKREEGELVSSMAVSSCKHCHGWTLQAVFALWKVGSSVVRVPQTNTGMCPSVGPRAGKATAAHFTSPVSSPKPATDRCSLPYCIYISFVTSDCRARSQPDQMLH